MSEKHCNFLKEGKLGDLTRDQLLELIEGYTGTLHGISELEHKSYERIATAILRCECTLREIYGRRINSVKE